MKNLLLISIIVLLSSCNMTTICDQNMNRASQWINTHPKPIFTKEILSDENSISIWTFTDVNGSFISTGYICGGFPDTIFNYGSQAVDLPEEYMTMSHNSKEPDTVLAFYDNDTVYINFLNKHIKYYDNSSTH